MKPLGVVAGFVLFVTGAFLSVQLLIPPVARWEPVGSSWGLLLAPTVAALGSVTVWLILHRPDGRNVETVDRVVLVVGLILLVAPIPVVGLASLYGSEILWFAAPVLVVFCSLPGIVILVAGMATRRRRRILGRPEGRRKR